MVQAALDSQMPSGLKLGEGVAAGLEITQGQEPQLVSFAGYLVEDKFTVGLRPL